jgi:hypothetical protein
MVNRRKFLIYAAMGGLLATAEWQPSVQITAADLPKWHENPQTAEEKFLARYLIPAVTLEKQAGIPREIPLTTAATETLWGQHRFFGEFDKNYNVLALSPAKEKTFTVGGKKYAIFKNHEEAFRRYGEALEFYNLSKGDPEELWRTDQIKALQNMFAAYQATSVEKQNYIAAWEGNFVRAVQAMNPAALPDPTAEPASQQPIIKDKTIILVAGHWILPGGSTGAPNERGMNMEIANILQPQLEKCGWQVRRPELVWLQQQGTYQQAGVSKTQLENLLKGRKNSPANYTSWSSYLNQSRDLMKANPGKVFWLEVHGQPWSKQYPYSLGSIGKTQFTDQITKGINNHLYPILEELYADSAQAIAQTRRNNGSLNLPSSNYGVTRRGGAIGEFFWSNRLPPKGSAQRKTFVEKTANAISKTLGC